MKKRLLTALATVTFLMIATSAMAITTNLLTNGSFENGLTGWTSGGTNNGYPVSVIQGNPSGAFGETVPVDNIVGGSPDLAGIFEAYFVDDSSTQWLKQSVYLDPGYYEIGFDTYSPQNGANNAFDAFFTGAIAGNTLASFSVKTSPVQQWLHFSGIANIITAGFYDVSFNFESKGAPGADVVVDRVYIAQSSAPVPEPGTMALLGFGMLSLVIFGKRRMNKNS